MPSPTIETARRATGIVLVAQVASQLVSIVSLAFLYRLLKDEDFGILGAVLPLAILPRMAATLGFTFTTIQRPDLSASERTALFWWNLLAATLAAVFTVILAWGTSLFFGDTETQAAGPATFISVAIALAITTVLTALGSQHQALLERELNFARLSGLRVAGQFVGAAMAIVLAWQSLGVWALVAQQLVEAAVISAGAWILEPWRPGPPRSGKLSGGATRFSFYLALTNLTFQLGQNLDKWVLPMMMPSGFAMLGLYSQAFNWMMRPVYLLTAPLSSVMLPMLSRMNERELAPSQTDETKADFAHAASVFYRLTAIVLFPVSVGLALTAPDAMLLLGGVKWKLAGWMLAVLALAIAPQGLINITGSLLAARGKAATLWLGSVAVTLALLAGYWLGSRYGVELVDRATDWGVPFPDEFRSRSSLATTMGVAIGFTVATVFVIALAYIPWAWRTAGLDLGELAAVVVKPIGASITMGVIVFFVQRSFGIESPAPDTRLAIRLISSVVIGVAAYSILNFVDVAWAITHGRNIGKGA